MAQQKTREDREQLWQNAFKADKARVEALVANMKKLREKRLARDAVALNKEK